MCLSHVEDEVFETPFALNVFPTRVFRNLTKLSTIKFKGQALTGTAASALSHLTQSHTLKM